MKGRRGNPGLKGRLVDKSVEAYILALETINRISIQYRIEPLAKPCSCQERAADVKKATIW